MSEQTHVFDLVKDLRERDDTDGLDIFDREEYPADGHGASTSTLTITILDRTACIDGPLVEVIENEGFEFESAYRTPLGPKIEFIRSE